MSLRQLLLIIHARLRLISTVFIAIVLVVVIVSVILPKRYTATATLVIDAKGLDPVTGVMLPYQLTPGYLATQEAIIGSHSVSVRVVKALRLQDVPVLQRQFASSGGGGDISDYIAAVLLKNLTVKPELNTNLVDVSFEASNPKFAAIVANAFAKAYIQTNLDLKTQPAQQNETWYESQVAHLRNRLQDAQNRLSSYQQKHGLVVSATQVDLENSRLADLSGQLVSAQASSIEATSNQRETPNLPDVVDNPIIQSLTPELATLDAKVAELSKTLGPNNPQLQSVLAQRNAIRRQIANAYQVAEKSMVATAKARRTRVIEMERAVAAQKASALKIKGERDQVALLQQDVQNAKLTYDAAMQRMSQNSLEAKSVQTDIAVLDFATPPVTPSSPKILLNSLIAVFLGTFCGVGLAFAIEMVDRKVRSVEDIQEAIGLPILNLRSDGPLLLGGSTRLLPWFQKRMAD